MSGRGPDPKELRASLVDSGWSVTPPPIQPVELLPAQPSGEHEAEDPSTRRLPNYEDLSNAPVVTQIDTDIHSRLQAMQRASLVDSHRPGVPDLPPPPPTRPPPPSLPPPPRASAPPAPPSDVPLPSFEPPPEPTLTNQTTPPLPAFGEQLRGSDSEPAEPTEIGTRGPFLPPSDPQDLVLPSLHTAPSLLSALLQRVRFAGGEVPLWSLLTPMVLLLALASAFVAAAASSSDGEAARAVPSAAPAPAAPSALASATAPELAPEPLASAPQTPALPASATDAEALAARRAEELSKDEALTLAAARREREVTRVAQLRQKLSRDPGLFKDAATLSELRRAAEDPLTAPDALSAMAEAPGPLSADLLYEVWTGTVARNSATELARSLVFSKEVRAKASPELAVALELRIAESCEQNLALLPRVSDKGDRRSLALLAKLARRYGCGPSKRADCYACLRQDKAVEDAMAAVKKRREPKPFSGK